MKKLFSLLALLLLVGCAKQSDNDQIKTNLGPYQYLGLRPELRVKIFTREIDPSDSEYYVITGVIEQTADFPVKEYTVNIRYTLKFGEAFTTEWHLSEKIKDRSVAFRDRIWLYKIPAEARKSTPTVEVGDADWWPSRPFKVALQDATQK